jgi:hypothetical protein
MALPLVRLGKEKYQTVKNWRDKKPMWKRYKIMVFIKIQISDKLSLSWWRV